MLRKLCLVLENNPSSTNYHQKRVLTLMEDIAEKIDFYTTKNFENSEQIRQAYQNQIKQFLKENSDYIQDIEHAAQSPYRGKIIILEMNTDGIGMNIIEKRVLYKKHLAAFPVIAKDRKTMLRFVQLERIGINEYGFKRLISPYIAREIKTVNLKSDSRRVQEIMRSLKRKKSSFYDIIRIICKAYEIERKGRKNLKTIDMIYKEQICASSIEKTVTDTTSLDEEEQFIYVNGVRFPIEEMVLLDGQKFEFQNIGEDDEIIIKAKPKKIESKQPTELIAVDDITYGVIDEQLCLIDQPKRK